MDQREDVREQEGDERRDDERGELGFRFADDYWEDAFNTLYDPAMRVCSVYGCQ